MQRFSVFVAAFLSLVAEQPVIGFTNGRSVSQVLFLQKSQSTNFQLSPLFMSDKEEAVVELGDDTVEDESKTKKVVAPFISQGEELAEGVLNPDLSDPKQARVILYTLISLLPVLFLIPFMISREFIPADMLPPVEIN
jgi:hypothetical protein